MDEYLKFLKKTRRKNIITWVMFGLAMTIYPLSTKTAGEFPLWVIGWICSMVGWLIWNTWAVPFEIWLTETIEKIDKGETQENGGIK